MTFVKSREASLHDMAIFVILCRVNATEWKVICCLCALNDVMGVPCIAMIYYG